MRAKFIASVAIRLSAYREGPDDRDRRHPGEHHRGSRPSNLYPPGGAQLVRSVTSRRLPRPRFDRDMMPPSELTRFSAQSTSTTFSPGKIVDGRGTTLTVGT